MLKYKKNLYIIFNIPDLNNIIININLNILWTILYKCFLIAYLLYAWHLNKKVLSYCKKLFESQEFWAKIYET